MYIKFMGISVSEGEMIFSFVNDLKDIDKALTLSGCLNTVALELTDKIAKNFPFESDMGNNGFPYTYEEYLSEICEFDDLYEIVPSVYDKYDELESYVKDKIINLKGLFTGKVIIIDGAEKPG